MTDRISFELEPCPYLDEGENCEEREHWCDGNVAAYIRCNGDNRIYNTETALELVPAGPTNLSWILKLKLVD